MTLAIDPALLRPDAVSEETRAFNAEFEATMKDLPKTHEVPVELTRQARDEGRGVFPPGGPLEGSDWHEMPSGRRVRISRPEGAPRAVYLHIHGGGWTLGRPSHYDRQNQARAKATGAVVVSVEYRLAPEHPFPSGPDDCLAAAEWALDEWPDLPFAIGGESAGAHLAAVTLLRLREAGRLDRFRGAVLNYGCFDLRMTASAANWGERQLVLSTPTMRFFASCFVPEAAKLGTPEVSPLLADLTDMPPALFQIGTADPLLDDSLLMAARWAGAGNGAELAVHPGGIHAFDMFDRLSIARDFTSRETGFLNRVFG